MTRLQAQRSVRRHHGLDLWGTLTHAGYHWPESQQPLHQHQYQQQQHHHLHHHQNQHRQQQQCLQGEPKSSRRCHQRREEERIPSEEDSSDSQSASNTGSKSPSEGLSTDTFQGMTPTGTDRTTYRNSSHPNPDQPSQDIVFRPGSLDVEEKNRASGSPSVKTAFRDNMHGIDLDAATETSSGQGQWKQHHQVTPTFPSKSWLQSSSTVADSRPSVDDPKDDNHVTRNACTDNHPPLLPSKISSIDKPHHSSEQTLIPLNSHYDSQPLPSPFRNPDDNLCQRSFLTDGLSSSMQTNTNTVVRPNKLMLVFPTALIQKTNDKTIHLNSNSRHPDCGNFERLQQQHCGTSNPQGAMFAPIMLDKPTLPAVKSAFQSYVPFTKSSSDSLFNDDGRVSCRQNLSFSVNETSSEGESLSAGELAWDKQGFKKSFNCNTNEATRKANEEANFRKISPYKVKAFQSNKTLEHAGSSLDKHRGETEEPLLLETVNNGEFRLRAETLNREGTHSCHCILRDTGPFLPNCAPTLKESGLLSGGKEEQGFLNIPDVHGYDSLEDFKSVCGKWRNPDFVLAPSSQIMPTTHASSSSLALDAQRVAQTSSSMAAFPKPVGNCIESIRIKDTTTAQDDTRRVDSITDLIPSRMSELKEKAAEMSLNEDKAHSEDSVINFTRLVKNGDSDVDSQRSLQTCNFDSKSKHQPPKYTYPLSYGMKILDDWRSTENALRSRFEDVTSTSAGNAFMLDSTNTTFDGPKTGAMSCTLGRQHSANSEWSCNPLQYQWKTGANQLTELSHSQFRSKSFLSQNKTSEEKVKLKDLKISQPGYYWPGPETKLRPIDEIFHTEKATQKLFQETENVQRETHHNSDSCKYALRASQAYPLSEPKSQHREDLMTTNHVLQHSHNIPSGRFPATVDSPIMTQPSFCHRERELTLISGQNSIVKKHTDHHFVGKGNRPEYHNQAYYRTLNAQNSQANFFSNRDVLVAQKRIQTDMDHQKSPNSTKLALWRANSSQNIDFNTDVRVNKSVFRMTDSVLCRKQHSTESISENRPQKIHSEISGKTGELNVREASDKTNHQKIGDEIVHRRRLFATPASDLRCSVAKVPFCEKVPSTVEPADDALSLPPSTPIHLKPCHESGRTHTGLFQRNDKNPPPAQSPSSLMADEEGSFKEVNNYCPSAMPTQHLHVLGSLDPDPKETPAAGGHSSITFIENTTTTSTTTTTTTKQFEIPRYFTFKNRPALSESHERVSFSFTSMNDLKKSTMVPREDDGLSHHQQYGLAAASTMCTPAENVRQSLMISQLNLASAVASASCSPPGAIGHPGSSAGSTAGQKAYNTCPVCFRIFTRSWLLKGHMRTHTGERPFRCSFPSCGKAFADKSNLRSHTLIHTASAKSFACQNCGRAFSQKRYLHKHMMEVCRVSVQ